MARTKSTARKEKIDPRDLASKIHQSSKPQKLSRKSKPRRRFSQNVRCLREIRKAVNALDNAIPKLSFQRLVREICDRYSLDSFRWTRTALNCIQEATEDFLIEFFQDAYICAAHAHRLTLMDKDMVILRRLRYRFSRVLELILLTDMKTFNILNVPLARRKKDDSGVRVEDVIHEKDTRQHEKEEKAKEEQADKWREYRRQRVEEREIEQLESFENELATLLEATNPKGFSVFCFLPGDLGKRTEVISFDAACVQILKDKRREVNDSLILAGLRCIMHEFPLDIQQKIEVFDPSISFFMRNELDASFIEHWLNLIDFDTLELLIIPYNENSHWSLIAIDLVDKQCFLINSMKGSHGNAKLGAKRLIEELEKRPPMPSDLLATMQYRQVACPHQDDSHSCGWRVIANARRMVNFVYLNDDKHVKFSKDCYTSEHIWYIRAKLLKYMIINCIQPTTEIGGDLHHEGDVVPITTEGKSTASTPSIPKTSKKGKRTPRKDSSPKKK